jgi:hypothetical protein
MFLRMMTLILVIVFVRLRVKIILLGRLARIYGYKKRRPN